MMKKNIAKLLVFAMLLSMLPFAAAAAETEATAASVSISDYVTISDVKVGGTALAAASVDGTYTFSTDTAVTLGDGNKVTVTFGVTGQNSATIYSVSRDTANLFANGSVSDEITVEDAAQAKNLTYTVKTKNPEKSASFKVTFSVADSTVAVESVTVTPETLSLKVGKTGKLTATVAPEGAVGDVIWTSDNTAVATVAEDGTVTAVAAGVANVTAKCGEMVSGACVVTVEAEKELTVSVDIGNVETQPETVDGKEVSTATIESEAVHTAIESAAAAATEEESSNEKIVAVVSIDLSQTAEGVKLDKSVFTKASGYNVAWDTDTKELVVSVKLQGGTVRLDSNAIKDIAGAGDENAVVMMSVTKPEQNEVPADKKPTENVTVKAIFNVNITVNGASPSWSGTENKITLTVANTFGVTETNKLKVYLDKVLAPDAKVTNNGDNLDIQVPHLSYITLAEEASSSDNNNKPSGSGGGGGGGGGGSSKPAIKPGDKPTTPGTTAPSGGVAGFNDVAPGAWYADSVKYVVEKGLFGGVGNGRFAPNDNMTRAMMWTVLARYMGVNTNTGSNWYEAARTWAMEKGISDGTMADGNVTREQFVTMLWRLSGEPTVDNGASFTDSGKVSGYAKTAVDWAVAQGIVNGYSDGTFKPQGSATRAEVAKMLTVFCQSAS